MPLGGSTGEYFYLYLRVLPRHQALVQDLLDEQDHQTHEGQSSSGPLGKSCLIPVDNVRDARLGIESTLRERGVPYEKTWDGVGEYEGGLEVACWRADGTLLHRAFLDDALEQMNNLADQVVQKALEDGSLASLLAERAQARRVTEIDWNAQDALCERRALTLPEQQADDGPAPGPRM